jgi:hypothetical protein
VIIRVRSGLPHHKSESELHDEFIPSLFFPWVVVPSEIGHLEDSLSA